MKQGIKTTEFWVTTLPIIATWMMTIKDYIPPKYATLATTIAGSAYAISRGLAKYSLKQ